MGLDMYLNHRVYVDDINHVVEEFGYWRKANAIHKWFVDNVQNGKDDMKEYPVSREQLAELKDLCQKVLHNPSHGSRLLPTTSGFFFGDTEYGQGYLDDLADTVKICQAALSTKEGEFYYQANW